MSFEFEEHGYRGWTLYVQPCYQGHGWFVSVHSLGERIIRSDGHVLETKAAALVWAKKQVDRKIGMG